jgi:hypothetical protein
MKICDACEQPNEKNKEVGESVIVFKGYHMTHHTHRGLPSNWSVDLCPKCAGQLKQQLDAVVKSFKAKS